MKILVSKFKSLGDVLLVTPLLFNLRKNFPDANIDVALIHGSEESIANINFVNDIILFKKKGVTSFKKSLLDLRNLLRIRKKKYDIYIATDRGERSALVSIFSGSKIRIGRKISDLMPLYRKAYTNYFFHHGDRHVIDLNLDPIRILGKRIYSRKIQIEIRKETLDRTKSFLKNNQKFIHIHPVSMCLYKCINDKTMAQIIDYCEFNLHVKVVLTSSPIEKEMKKMDSIMKYVDSNPIDLSGKLTFEETIAINSLSSLAITVDTAIAHVAYSNNIPSVVFFGPTKVNCWGPYNSSPNQKYNEFNNSLIVQIGKNDIFLNKMNCVPCTQVGCNNSGKSQCLESLDLSEIQQILKNKKIL